MQSVGMMGETWGGGSHGMDMDKHPYGGFACAWGSLWLHRLKGLR